MTANKYSVSSENFLNLIVVTVVQLRGYIKTTEFYIFKKKAL